jgi:hypothetical protein
VSHWLAGYLTAYNRWQPETYDITGDPHASDWETWIQQYCAMNPTIQIAQAAEAFVHAFYPSRLTQAPNEVRPPAPQTIPPTRGQAPRTRQAAAPPLGIPASVVNPTQAPLRRDLIHYVQEHLQSAGFSAGAMDGGLELQTRDTLR